MPQLKKTAMKWLKFLHLIAACSWVGGALALAVLNISNPLAENDGMLAGINLAGHQADIWVVVIPGAFGCLLTGLLYALFTPWGFFKHGWLICKWVITIGAILSGTFLLGVWEESMLELSKAQGLAALSDPGYLSVKCKHLTGGIVQISMLLLALWLSVFKPRKKQS